MRQAAESDASAARWNGWSPGRLLLLVAIATACLLLPAVSASAETVTVTLSGSGAGTVASQPAGINCTNVGNPGGPGTGTCSFNFPGLNPSVRLTATPSAPSLFQKWLGTLGNSNTCASGNKNPCEFVALAAALGGGPIGVTAFFNPPPPPPSETVTTGSSGVVGNLAKLEGTTNPSSSAWPLSSCRFEYGETSEYGQSVPCEQSQVGPATGPVAVSAAVNLLRAATTYHFRLVVGNLSGSDAGGDQTLTAAGAPVETCANSSIRVQQAASFLPECRAYEKVSPEFKQSGDAAIATPTFGSFAPVAPDGTAVGWRAVILGNFIAHRSASGWFSLSTLPPASLISASTARGASSFLSSDLSLRASCGGSAPSESIEKSQPSAYPTVCAFGDEGASWTIAPDLAGFLGTSADFSHVVFAKEGGLYEVVDPTGPAPLVRRVDTDDGGLPLGSAPPVLGGPSSIYQAVSADGSTIYFTTTPTAGVSTIYARVNGSTTTAISPPFAAECTTCSPTVAPPTYLGASADGSKAFFSTAQQLVNSDTDSTADIYEYDFANPGHHVQVSAGGAGDLTPGSGAEVQGAVQVSEDGSHVYFIAKGLLTTAPNSAGDSAVTGGQNLYVYERDADFPQGRTGFVGTVPAGEVKRLTEPNPTPSQATPDGRYLVFQTAAQLITSGPEADTDGAGDVYRYDARTGELNRVSIGEPSYPDSGNGNTPGVSAELQGAVQSTSVAQSEVSAHAVISDDGSAVVFVTPEKLQAEDLNSVAPAARCSNGGIIAINEPGCDVYLWRDGAVRLVSPAEPGVRANGSSPPNGSISASGGDVFFATTSQLVPADGDENSDVYDARVGGGFPYSPPAPACAGNEACHGASPGAPSSEAVGSSGFSGPGNESSPPPAKKKHHKKKHHKKHKAHKHAGKKRAPARRNGRPR